MAENKNGAVLIETRGEGGYFVCAPTPGYTVCFGELSKIPLISDEEYGALISSAIALDEKEHYLKSSIDTDISLDSPFDDYDQNGNLKQELLDHGWSIIKEENGVCHFVRPGKKVKTTSATFNHIPNRFYCFSTSTQFTPHEVLKPYAVYAFLNHDGDFIKARKALLDAGFGKRAEQTFWYLEKNKKGEDTLKVDHNKLIQFLGTEGFRKIYIHDAKTSTFLKVEDTVIDEVSPEQIKDYIVSFVKSLPDQIECGNSTAKISRNRLLSILIRGANIYFGRDKLEFLEKLEGEIHRDSKNNCFFYYDNCIVEVTKNGAIIKNYDQLKGFVWRHRKQSRPFTLLHNNKKKGEYEQFIENVCNKEQERIIALKSAIGYLLHQHREESKTKAVILIDEKISDSFEPEGRTGKSLLGKSLHHLRCIAIMDGKKFDGKNRFGYQNVPVDCDVIMIDDAKSKFPFETLFHDITAGIEVERKNLPAIRVPFDASPRFLITTNHAILGNSGSYRDRMMEYEFASYYSDTFSPKDEFKHNLFSEWDDTEWNQFDNFMIGCAQLYLKGGIKGYTLKTLHRRKLIEGTSSEFVDFMDDAFETGLIKYETFNVTEDLFHKFKQENSGTFDELKSNRFTIWIQKYASAKGCSYLKDSKRIIGQTKRGFILSRKKRKVTKLHSKNKLAKAHRKKKNKNV